MVQSMQPDERGKQSGDDDDGGGRQKGSHKGKQEKALLR